MLFCCLPSTQKKSEHFDSFRTDRKCCGVALPLSVALIIIGIISLAGLDFLPQGVSIAFITAPSLFILAFIAKRKRDETIAGHEISVPWCGVKKTPKNTTTVKRKKNTEEDTKDFEKIKRLTLQGGRIPIHPAAQFKIESDDESDE